MIYRSDKVRSDKVELFNRWMVEQHSGRERHSPYARGGDNRDSGRRFDQHRSHSRHETHDHASRRDSRDRRDDHRDGRGNGGEREHERSHSPPSSGGAQAAGITSLHSLHNPSGGFEPLRDQLTEQQAAVKERVHHAVATKLLARRRKDVCITKKIYTKTGVRNPIGFDKEIQIIRGLATSFAWADARGLLNVSTIREPRTRAAAQRLPEAPGPLCARDACDGHGSRVCGRGRTRASWTCF